MSVYLPDSSRPLGVKLVVPMLPVDAALAHPDVRMGRVAHDPVEVRPIVPAGGDAVLSEAATIELRGNRVRGHITNSLEQHDQRGKSTYVDSPSDAVEGAGDHGAEIDGVPARKGLNAANVLGVRSVGFDLDEAVVACCSKDGGLEIAGGLVIGGGRHRERAWCRSEESKKVE